MKSNKFKMKISLVVLFLGLMTFTACKEDEEIFEKTRLFRPVLNEDLYAEDNTIIVDMGSMKEAISYTIEISRDTFKTVTRTIETDTSYVEIPDLLWNTIYQVQATAHAADAQYDSKISDLGAVRTARFPSIMGIPKEYDVTDVAARVFWTTAGAPVTGIKVFARSDEELANPLLEFEITVEDQAAGEKAIYGLEPFTEYQIALYSEETVRGWENYTTKPALPMGEGVVDLRGITKSSILADTLPDIASGSIVILESGMTYDANGHKFDKSVSIRSGYGFNPSGAIIDCGSNFNFEDKASVDSIVFRGLTLVGDIGGKYVFNIDKSATVGELKFESCHITELRGVMRMKGSGTGVITNYSFNNCMIDSIGGYGILTLEPDGWAVKNVMITNSTISKTELFMRNKGGTTNFDKILIDGCTINEVPKAGNAIFRFDSGVGVTNGISIHNTIWGPGWNTDGEEVPSVKGIDGDGLENTNFDIKNTYATSDFSFSGDEIPGFPSFVYSKNAEDLWVAPFTGLDFNIKDASGFAGKSDAGDPRWRLTL